MDFVTFSSNVRLLGCPGGETLGPNSDTIFGFGPPLQIGVEQVRLHLSAAAHDGTRSVIVSNATNVAFCAVS